MQQIDLITCNPKRNQVVTSSPGKCNLPSFLQQQTSLPFSAFFSYQDAQVLVWRVYPFTKTMLAVMMSFSVLTHPSHMVTSLDRLCMAANNHETASFSTIVYSLLDTSQLPHTCKIMVKMAGIQAIKDTVNGGCSQTGLHTSLTQTFSS